MKIEIDEQSGFCFGVVKAIERAEEEIELNVPLRSLGDIVHNKVEMERLARRGLVTVSHSDIPTLTGARLFIRAHGEPPSTYREAEKLGITLIDATCPVVAKLQESVREADRAMSRINGQVVIFGKHGHPEVLGLNGQIDNRAIIVENMAEMLEKVDFSRPVFLLSQTTKPLSLFNEMSGELKKKCTNVTVKDTICRSVSNRAPQLRDFASRHDLVLFVSGRESSNGRMLFEECLSANPNCRFIEDESEIEPSWLKNIETVGICGATSTPRWLMERVKKHLEK